MRIEPLMIAGLVLATVACEAVKSESTHGTEVKLCDGKTTHTIPAGQQPTRENAVALTAALMAKWQAENPDRDWVTRETESHRIEPPADNSHLVGKNPEGSTYGEVTELDVRVWNDQTRKLVVAGSRVFHSADELGSTIAVSCDMCHPDAANTHPETYPKYQTQMGRTVLLRDMINWCLEHPVRAEPMAADDPRMRAMEAYILAQRRGHALSYNKH